MSGKRRVNVTYEGKVVGTAELSDGNLVGEIELEPKDLKHIIPGRSLTESLSIAFKDVETLDLIPPYPDWDVEMAERRYGIHPKGTFDA